MAHKILLIEDEPDIREQLRDYLALLYPESEILTAATVAEAQKLLDRGDFSLVISDCQLPDGLACDILSLVRERAPLIILTGYVEEEELSRVRRSVRGPIHVLKKPASLAEIAQIVQKHLGRP
ncbi:MAG: hypothetical protein DSZ24_02090 [Thermodesulfatator sp.]|nr:MAG: hypothetical protein DSZ24_02090 [Thermodesulfatator sp.]